MTTKVEPIDPGTAARNPGLLAAEAREAAGIARYLAGEEKSAIVDQSLAIWIVGSRIADNGTYGPRWEIAVQVGGEESTVALWGGLPVTEYHRLLHGMLSELLTRNPTRIGPWYMSEHTYTNQHGTFTGFNIHDESPQRLTTKGTKDGDDIPF